MNAASVISSAIKNGLRFIKVLRLGRKDVQEHAQASPFGYESAPIENLRAIYARTEESGKAVLIGYININALESLQPGETTMFSTNAEGVRQFEIVLRNNGQAEIGGTGDNMVRFKPLETALNETTNKLNQHINNWNTFAAVYVPGVSPPAALISSSSGANISSAKIDEIETSGV